MGGWRGLDGAGGGGPPRFISERVIVLVFSATSPHPDTGSRAVFRPRIMSRKFAMQQQWGIAAPYFDTGSSVGKRP